MNGLQRHMLSAVTMAAGSAVVFAFLVVMNSFSTPPPKVEKQASANFEVQKQPKKKKKPKPRKARPQKAAKPRPTAAPTPVLAGGLASVSLDLPGFDPGNLGEGADDLLGNSNKEMVMDEKSVDEPPRAISRVAPSQYPEAARKQGITGYVKMNLLIGTSGEVERVKVLEASPAGVFDQVALETIRRWRFEPAVYQAEHVRVWATQTIRFELE